MADNNKIPASAVPDIANCPHCGTPLSSWQQIILSVDKVLMCRNCWYRIEYSPPEQTKQWDE